MGEQNESIIWLELMASKGLKALGQKLQSKCGKKLIITGRQGIAHYPESGIMAPDEIQGMLERMPDFAENQYYYAKNQQRLVCKVILEDEPDGVLLLFWEQVDNEDIDLICKNIDQAQLALRWYLRGHRRFAQRLHEQRAAFFEGVFIKHNIGVESLLKEQGINIHSDREYAVMLMDMGWKIYLMMSPMI